MRFWSFKLILDVTELLMAKSSHFFRFALDPVDFYMARIMYTVSMVLSFMRMLRMGYIVQALGPRIMSIGKLVIQIIFK